MLLFIQGDNNDSKMKAKISVLT